MVIALVLMAVGSVIFLLGWCTSKDMIVAETSSLESKTPVWDRLEAEYAEKCLPTKDVNLYKCKVGDYVRLNNGKPPVKVLMHDIHCDIHFIYLEGMPFIIKWHSGGSLWFGNFGILATPENEIIEIIAGCGVDPYNLEDSCEPQFIGYSYDTKYKLITGISVKNIEGMDVITRNAIRFKVKSVKRAGSIFYEIVFLGYYLPDMSFKYFKGEEIKEYYAPNGNYHTPPINENFRGMDIIEVIDNR